MQDHRDLSLSVSVSLCMYVCIHVRMYFDIFILKNYRVSLLNLMYITFCVILIYCHYVRRF